MPLCIICETEKPDAEFKVRRGVAATECIACEAALKAKRPKKTFIAAVINAGEAPKMASQSAEGRLKQAIELRMEFYKSTALEALHDLAQMPIDGANSATLQVKYLAACRLAGPAAEAPQRTDNPMEGVLKQLSESYHQNAPKIREIRERTLIIDNVNATPQ